MDTTFALMVFGYILAALGVFGTLLACYWRDEAVRQRVLGTRRGSQLVYASQTVGQRPQVFWSKVGAAAGDLVVGEALLEAADSQPPEAAKPLEPCHA
jgi:hypothetical protein